MGDIFFSTNPSDYAKLEGLYVAEQKPPGFINGVDFSTVGFAGTCVRGPTTPTPVGSTGEFINIFGGRDYGGGGAIIGNIWAALLNKPFANIVVRRVAAAGAVAGSHQFSNSVPTPIIQVNASSVGAWSLGMTADIEAPSDGISGHFNVRCTYLGRDYLAANVDVTTGNDNTALVIPNDPSWPFTLTKLASGTPTVPTSAVALSGGSDGSVAASDYVAGLQDLASFPGVDIVLIPEIPPTPSTVQAEIVTLAPTVADRIFLTWAMAFGNSVSSEITAEAAAITTQSDRIVWCYNAPYTLDPTTGLTFQQAPHIWMASILSQVDVDVHPGSFQTQGILAGITSLTNPSQSRADLINLKAAGICSLEQLPGGFQFHSGVTTNLTPGLTEIVRRREADFLQLSAAAFLAQFVKGKNTPVIRAQMAGALAAFSNSLMKQGRIVANFAIDQKSVNSDVLRAEGEEHILWTVQLFSNMLALVLNTEISTGAITAQAA